MGNSVDVRTRVMAHVGYPIPRWGRSRAQGRRAAVCRSRTRADGGAGHISRTNPRFRCRQGRLRGTYGTLGPQMASRSRTKREFPMTAQASFVHSTAHAGNYPRNYPLQPDDDLHVKHLLYLFSVLTDSHGRSVL